MARRQPMNDERMSQIGARIRIIRLETGLSLRDLAQKAERSVDSIMQIELGRSAISTGMLRDIANGLNVRPFDLLNLDAQNDDLGYIIELMRQNPKTAILIKKLLNAEDDG
jgi:transcriptional regulator with XRE-family HTH domain